MSRAEMLRLDILSADDWI